MLRSYDSPAMGGLQYPHRWGCVANTADLKLLKNQGSRAEVLRIGRKSIVRVDVICCFMQINEGRDLLDRNQVLAVK